MTPSNLDLARECGAHVYRTGTDVVFDTHDQLDTFADRIRADAIAEYAAMTEKGAKAWADVPNATAWVDELRGNAPVQPVALPAGMPEPVAWIAEYGGDIYTAAQVQAMLAQGLAPGWKAVPVEPTPEIIAAAAIASWPVATLADIEIGRKAAPIILMALDSSDGVTVGMLAATIATMAPAYRAMITAAPQPSATEVVNLPLSESAISHCINASGGELRALARIVERQCALAWGVEIAGITTAQPDPTGRKRTTL